MGQKTHPIGFRLGIIKTWSSEWYEEKNYAKWLHEDIKLKKFIKKKLQPRGRRATSRSSAPRTRRRSTSTPRVRASSSASAARASRQLKKEVQALTENEVFLNIQEVRKAETNAQLVAENIATQLERRVAFRRAMKKAMQTAMKFGAKGIRVASAGRLGGAEMCAPRVVPRGSRAAAHAARRHRVRLRRGPHDVRHDRRQVLDLQGRGAADARRHAAPAAPRLSRKGVRMPCCPRSEPSSARCRRAACAAAPRAATTSRSATSACRSLECGWITARQIEAARIAITRHIKRGGKIYIRVFPDKPITKKPAETRMGKGKGGVEGWVAVVKPGPRDVRDRRRRREAGARGVPPARTTSCRSRPAWSRAEGCSDEQDARALDAASASRPTTSSQDRIKRTRGRAVPAPASSSYTNQVDEHER